MSLYMAQSHDLSEQLHRLFEKESGVFALVDPLDPDAENRLMIRSILRD